MTLCIFAVYSSRGLIRCPREDVTTEHHIGHVSRGHQYYSEPEENRCGNCGRVLAAGEILNCDICRGYRYPPLFDATIEEIR